MTTDTRNQALRDALKLAANRIARLSLECQHGTSLRYDAGEWAEQARALAMQEPASRSDTCEMPGGCTTPDHCNSERCYLDQPASEPAPASARDPMIGVMASLVAAISILQRAFDEKKPPNKVIASDTMFRQMLTDYERALDVARASLKDTAPASAPSCQCTAESGCLGQGEGVCDPPAPAPSCCWEEAAKIVENMPLQTYRNMGTREQSCKQTTFDDAAAALRARTSCRCGELREATSYAEQLAIALHGKHHQDVPQWKPLSGDLIGLLTQIDNMTATLSVPSPEGDRK